MTATTFATAVTATVAAIATAATATTAAGSLQRVVELLQFRLLCRTSLNNRTHELQITAGKRMVEVHNYLQWSNFLYSTKDWGAVGTHHLNHIALVDVGRIELAVNGKHLAVKILDMVGVILAVCIGKGDSEVELVTLLQILEVLLKSIECVAHACQKGKWLLTCCLFNLFTLTVTV